MWRNRSKIPGKGRDRGNLITGKGDHQLARKKRIKDGQRKTEMNKVLSRNDGGEIA